MNIVLQPVGGIDAVNHYESTIEISVKFDQIFPFVKDYVKQQLTLIYPNKESQIWGVTSGKRNINVTKYNKLMKNDVVLFVNDQGVFEIATITFLDRNANLAKNLWGVDREGNTWENMYYLSNLRKKKIDYFELNSLLKRQLNARVQGFTVIDAMNCVDLMLKVTK
jgi:hypothetical protein